MTPELRKDPIRGQWVIIAPERAGRPQDKIIERRIAPAGVCPFCAGNEALTPPAVIAYPSSPAEERAPWSLRIFPNKYPALTDRPKPVSDDAFFERKNALGLHEVIVETPQHLTDVLQLSEERFAMVLRSYRERMAALRHQGWPYVLLYKNQGAQSGATLEHIHSQLIALPVVPSQAEAELNAGQLYYETHKRCIYCDIVTHELKESVRVVSQTEKFVLFVPFAARFPYETWIVPKQHSSSFEDSSEDDTAHLAYCLRRLLVGFEGALQAPAFNYIVHSAEPTHNYFHWRIEVLPRLVHLAGLEWGSGLFINPVAPEEAARLLRETVP